MESNHTANTVANMIADVLELNEDSFADEVGTVRSFNDAGLMTSNKGIVIRMNDGTEFQVSVVQSR